MYLITWITTHLQTPERWMAELAKACSMQPYIILYKTTLQLGVRNLPKVFTRQRPGRESNRVSSPTLYQETTFWGTILISEDRLQLSGCHFRQMSEELEEMIEFQWMSLTLVDYRKDIQLHNLCTSYLSWNVLSLPSLPSLLLLASVLRNISSFYILNFCV